MGIIEPRILDIVFTLDQKHATQILGKKEKSDYLLNVNKIIKDKFSQELVIPNKVQSFLLNYEIKKIIDKAVNVRNRKYKRIIYINSNLTVNAILNTIDFLKEHYKDIVFKPSLIDLEIELNHILLPIKIIT